LDTFIKIVLRHLKEAELSIFEYIEAWYNVNRIHTTIKTSIKNKKK